MKTPIRLTLALSALAIGCQNARIPDFHPGMSDSEVDREAAAVFPPTILEKVSVQSDGRAVKLYRQAPIFGNTATWVTVGEIDGTVKAVDYSTGREPALSYSPKGTKPMEVTCHECRGTGGKGSDVCRYCRGTGKLVGMEPPDHESGKPARDTQPAFTGTRVRFKPEVTIVVYSGPDSDGHYRLEIDGFVVWASASRLQVADSAGASKKECETKFDDRFPSSASALEIKRDGAWLVRVSPQGDVEYPFPCRRESDIHVKLRALESALSALLSGERLHALESGLKSLAAKGKEKTDA